jgi:alpha-tubulin suppressor-like RCC1 family protein
VSVFHGALTSQGDLWMWGENDRGQLGNGVQGTCLNIAGAVDQPTPAGIGLSGVIAIGTGSRQSIALTQEGKVYVWGLTASQNGEVKTTPQEVPGLVVN